MPAPPSGTEAVPLRVLLVSDVRLYRDGLVWGLAGNSRIRIAATAETGTQALSHLQDSSPAVLLVDMSMADALPLIRAAGVAHPEVKVVAFAVGPGDGAILECIEAGVAAYVPRDGSLDELVSTVESAVRGEAPCSPRMAASLFRRIASLAGGRPAESHVPLTDREHQIVELIEQGCSNKEIGTRLGIELATVKNHLHNILDKLKVQRRSQVGLRLGWRRHRLSPEHVPPVGSRSGTAGP